MMMKKLFLLISIPLSIGLLWSSCAKSGADNILLLKINNKTGERIDSLVFDNVGEKTQWLIPSLSADQTTKFIEIHIPIFLWDARKTDEPTILLHFSQNNNAKQVINETGFCGVPVIQHAWTTVGKFEFDLIKVEEYYRLERH
jgi:hypothetical protein